MKPPIAENRAGQSVSGRPPSPRRSLGQNFLGQPQAVRTIIAKSGLRAGGPVVELGVGLGALTRALAEVASRVIGIEIDTRLIEWLETGSPLPPNVELRHGDMREIALSDLSAELGGPLQIVGNLPYYLSTQIAFKLWEERAYVERAVLMFQKEVARRLMAPPGGKDYGILSVLLGNCTRMTKLLELSPRSFWPRPQVSSTVVRIEFVSPKWLALDQDLFRRVVRKAFGQRRKMVLNALKGLEGLPEEAVAEALDVCGISPTRRPEALEIKEFVCLANALRMTRVQGAQRTQ